MKSIIEWKQFLIFLSSEFVVIARNLYLLYIIILGLFGMLLSFLFGLYKYENEINGFFLLKIIYNTGFDDILWKYLHDSSLETNTAETFSKFSLKSIEQIDPRPLKITLKEPEQIPFLIIEDPLVFIDTEVLWDESTNYQFELFKFYRYINQKI